jgi:PAS domain S-box-containing protein
MHSPGYATRTVYQRSNVSHSSFETLLARLTGQSCGLNQDGLLQLFSQIAQEFFGASAVCCCQGSGEGKWRIAKSAGVPLWGTQGEAVSSGAGGWLAQAFEHRRATPSRFPPRERAGHRGNTEWTQIAVPLSSRSELFEGALLGWQDAQNIQQEELLRQLTLFGTYFSGLLEQSRLFAQVYNSRERWVRVIDAIPDSIIVHNPKGEIVRINRPLAERLGVHPSKLIGRPIAEVLGTGPKRGGGLCPHCLDQPGETQGPVELLADGSFLVSTTKITAEHDADAQTIHVLVNIRERLEAERRYRDLFDSIQEGAFICNPDGRIVEANRFLVQMLGCARREDLLQKNLFEVLLPPSSRGQLLETLRAVDALRDVEIELRKQDGSPLEVLLHVAAVRDNKGTLVQYRGLILDITDQKDSRAALRRERDFNRSILDHTQNIILVLDASGQIDYVNQRALEIGYSAEALQGLPLARLVHTSHRPVFREALRAVLDGGEVQRVELPLLRGDGGVAQFIVNLSSMREERGEAQGAVVVMTDITEDSLLQAKLAHAEKMAALGQLVSGVAHEVNNPLSAIVGFSDLLLENPDLPGFARENLGVILEEAERTRLIVQNMLRFAREMPPQREPVQINPVLRQALKLRSYGVATRNVDIVERLTEHLPVVVADPHQLEQVFLNILNNAFDAVEQIGRRGRIEVETAACRGNIEIYFRDNGPGIPNLDRIFEPFFTTKPVGKGTGLGLSICYGIIQAHDGEILCQNNGNGEGCTILIRLPAAAISGQDKPARPEI